MSDYSISETQWKIMEVIWKRKEVTAAEVIDELVPETGWNHQTVRTLLARLVQKKVLQTQSVRNYYVYSPLISREEAIQEEGNAFLNRIFGGKADELLVHFVREGNISSETLERLQLLLALKKEKTKEDDGRKGVNNE
ncbi:MAG: BlaI/MecI/CopY family transcriptional regulator [Thermoguttaceae bacterium]